MFPRANSLRRTDVDNLGSFEGTNTVRNDAILCPIATTNHVTCTNRCKRYGMLLAIVLRIEERTTPALDSHLTSSLRRRIWIVTSERIGLNITLQLLAVVVTFIGSNHHTHLHALGGTNCLHNVNSTHHVHFIGIHRYLIRETNERLSCKMEDNLRLILSKNLLHLLAIANVGTNICLNLTADTREYKVVTLREWGETYTHYFCSEFMEPNAQPRAFETGVARYKHPLAFEPLNISMFISLTFYLSNH